MASAAVDARRNGFIYIRGEGIRALYDVLDAQGKVVGIGTRLECLILHRILVYERGELN